jgi:hypothetical protein
MYSRSCGGFGESGDRAVVERLFEANDEVIVTYEATRTDSRRFRNTEIFGFDGDKISRVEVCFGWDID